MLDIDLVDRAGGGVSHVAEDGEDHTSAEDAVHRVNITMMLFVMKMTMVMVMMDSVEEPGDTVADGDEHRVPHAVVVEPDNHRVREQRLVIFPNCNNFKDVLLQHKSPPHHLL